MKKTAIATTALLAVTLFSTVAPAVHAADITKKTTGDVNFTESTTNPGGALDLVKAPSVDFGDKEISGSTKKYDLTTVDGIQVDDNRGSNVGWKLQVSNTQFTGTKALDGAKLTFTNDKATNDNIDPKYAATSEAEVALDGSGNVVNVMNALKDTGMGINTLPVTKAELEVPGASTKLKEKYTSEITWTLSDAPL
ncbi:WxL domain-containing protein [Dellaglioa algida]|uniref:WxL domain-containing protein n=1 Tax=Dellaglioa algida TaxID=105612 RepID=A0A5C6MBR5_9LACO|nr:WxL domain-containing protein [Dellaglioa algida]MDK1716938.1 WxL domain-containing protein [Dellaglioa algida]MDK1719712.1 WxL domain-containing protein [Dellaglioa algida]MDK1721827.1 WxL domain-containing protein [Dellaglioa algida]MDK1723055.1 WxL domain-containing protein [Dellaglioa algida]MDK1724674.1 WxL domain-containing protein [Dellaglioa algida]